MEVTNKGYINFDEKYNRKTDKFMTASMSFTKGKDESGKWVNGYINVIAFGENIPKLEASIDKLTEIKGKYSHKKADEKGVYPQITIKEFLSDVQQNTFANTQRLDVYNLDDSDMPF